MKAEKSSVCQFLALSFRSRVNRKKKLKKVFIQGEKKSSKMSSNETFIDTSLDWLSTMANQFMQLIFCLLAVISFARFISYMLARRPIVEVEVAVEEKPVEVIASKIEEVKKEEEKQGGWESQSFFDNPQKPHLEVTQKNIKQKLKIPRRKCMSVGPVMLTPHSQIIRKLNVEEREERYRYDILPINTIQTPPTPTSSSSGSAAIVAIIGDDDKIIDGSCM